MKYYKPSQTGKTLFTLVFTLILCSLLMAPMITAFEFDNVASYNSETKVYTIENAYGLGSTIAELELITPLNFMVSRGYNYVAEIEMSNYENTYGNAFQDMNFYQINSGMQGFTRDFTYAYQTYEEEVFDVLEEVCEGTPTTNQERINQCEFIEVGNETRLIEKWERFSDIDELPQQESIRIRIYTEVQVNDRVEWIPTMFGIYLEEWAVWTEAMNTGLTSYYTLNGSAGDVIDSVGNFTGTNVGADRGIAGVIDDSFDFTAANSDYVNIGLKEWGSLIDDGWSANFWANTNDTTAKYWFGTADDDDNPTLLFQANAAPNSAADAGKMHVSYRDSAGNNIVGGLTNDETWSDASWHMITLTMNMSNNSFAIYIDGDSKDITYIAQNSPSGFVDFQHNITLAAFWNKGTGADGFLDTMMDEVGFWQRILTDSEITDLYNGGSGITYTDIFGAPEITLVNPTGNLNSTITNPTLEITATDDSGVVNVSLFVDGALSTYNDSGVNGTYYFTPTLTQGLHNWSVGMEDDSAQTVNSTTYNITVDWMFFANSTYNTTVIEGNNNLFLVNVTTNGTNTITIANLTYDTTGEVATTGYLATTSVDGNVTTLSKAINAPLVSAVTNVTFLWNVTMSDGYINQSASQNQTITEFSFDNCSTNSVVLYNFTIKDEKTQAILNGATDNTTGKIDITLYTLGRASQLLNYSDDNNETNPFSVCINSTLSSGEQYNIDVQIQYDADGYAAEFYHIQNATISSASIPTNITLYDLDDATAQEFLITYKDSNFLAVEDALIQISRKYIDEGVFKTVEIPKTDSKGETIARLELSDVLYTFTVIKNAVTLATFDNVLAKCDNVATGDCEINLNAFSSAIDSSDFTTLDDFSFTVSYDNDTREVSTIFSVPSGSASAVLLNVTLLDNLGTTNACSDTLTTSSGTLTCTVPNALGNGSVIVEVYKDGTLQGSGIIGLDKRARELYGASLVFLALFLYLTLFGIGVSDSPLFTGIMIGTGAILAVALNVVDATGYVGATSTILWLGIAIAILLIKGSKRQ